VGLEDEVGTAPPTPEDLALGARITHLAQDPSDDARARIMAAVRSAPMPATAARGRVAMGSRWRLGLVGLGATGLLLVASAGALAASSDALPSSPAYGLRRFQENLRVAVASQRQQPRLRLEFAEEKLNQAKALVVQGDVSDATRLLEDSQHDLQDANAELQDLHDPAEALGLANEEAKVQADVANQQGQVDTIVKGGTITPPVQENPTSGDSPNPAPEATAHPNSPEASPDSSSSSSPE
jgi:hypothetical protein